jgi:O-antigen ligase
MSTFEMAVTPELLAPKSDADVRTSISPFVAETLLFLIVTITTLDLAPEVKSSNFSAGAQSLLRLCLCAACGFYGLLFLPCTLPRLLSFPGAWTLLFGLWALVTVPLSVSPMFSASAAFALWCIILFAPAVVTHLGEQRTLTVLLRALLCFVAINWLLYFFVPSLGRSLFEMPNGEIIYRFGNDSQQLGLQVAWAIGFLLVLTFSALRGWTSTLLILPILIITLPLTQSRTAMLTALAVGGYACWFYASVRTRVALILLGSLAIAMALGAFALSGNDFDWDTVASRMSRSGNADEIQNLTGRTAVWDHAWKNICDSPLVGCGYGCSRFVMDDERLFGTFVPNHAHNLYLNAALCMGFPGAAIIAAMFIHQAIRTWRYPNVVPGIALIVVLVAGIAEYLLFGPMPRSHTVIWLITLFWQADPMSLTNERRV